jgi:hypothetical protein
MMRLGRGWKSDYNGSRKKKKKNIFFFLFPKAVSGTIKDAEGERQLIFPPHPGDFSHP